jgi:hypothetical protein
VTDAIRAREGVTPTNGYCSWKNICDGTPGGSVWCGLRRSNCEEKCGGSWCAVEAFCSWLPCDDGVQIKDNWCSAAEEQCRGTCQGSWCRATSELTPPATPTSTAPADPSNDKAIGEELLYPGYCSWSSDCSSGVAQGGEFCNKGLRQCAISCAGTWCLGSPDAQSMPTVPPPPVVEPYCSWRMCDGAAQGGPWCNKGGPECRECGGEWCTETRLPPTPESTTSAPTAVYGDNAPAAHVFYGWYPNIAAALNTMSKEDGR